MNRISRQRHRPSIDPLMRIAHQEQIMLASRYHGAQELQILGGVVLHLIGNDRGPLDTATVN